jgi:hypothetical protein
MRFRRFSRRSRRFGQVIFVVVLAALLAEAAALGLRSNQLHRRAAPLVATSVSLPVTTVAATPTTSPPRPTTTTTISPSVKRPDSVTYTLSAPAQVTVAATADCWVEARAGSVKGKAISVMILRAGQHESFRAPVWLRLGNPTAVRVTAGTTALELPSDGPGNLILTVRSH